MMICKHPCLTELLFNPSINIDINITFKQKLQGRRLSYEQKFSKALDSCRR